MNGYVSCLVAVSCKFSQKRGFLPFRTMFIGFIPPFFRALILLTSAPTILRRARRVVGTYSTRLTHLRLTASSLGARTHACAPAAAGKRLDRVARIRQRGHRPGRSRGRRRRGRI